MSLWTIPAGHDFLECIAQAWLDRDASAPASGLILLPTRRAARALRDAFLRVTDGRPTLLPRIAPIASSDDTGLALTGALDLPPAVEPNRRLAVLTRMILALNGAFGAPGTPDRAWPLAQALAALLDEAAWAETDLAAALPDLVGGEYAQHWQQILQFLRIVTHAWPDWLAEHGLMDPIARQVALLHRQARAWEDVPTAEPVWAAGMTGGLQAEAHLLRTISRLPNGLVALPALDTTMPDSAWNAIGLTHPQFALRRLLGLMNVTRADVQRWPGLSPTPRVETLQRALLPAAALADWRADPAPDLPGITRLKPADRQQEAVAIALALRQGLEKPGNRVALITPDRELALRVSAELARFGVVADDSAGEQYSATPAGAFLRILAETVRDQLAPVPLLSLLKHPMASFGLGQGACRTAARKLERACLRGPRPAPGIAGLRAALRADAAPDIRDLIDRLEAALTPLQALTAQTTPDMALTALLQAAEAAATTEFTHGGAILWRDEEGYCLAQLLAAAIAAMDILPPMPPSRLPHLLDAVLANQSVRTRRSLRGRDDVTEEHPRVFIWGLLEARLQSVDLAVLGSLSESIWPSAPDSGPWLNRAMRQQIGLPLPEERIGEMAHDFLTLASAASEAVLSCPVRQDGAPAVPSRWLVRLEALLRGHARTMPDHIATQWAQLLDQHPEPPQPVLPPTPRPPVSHRPRRMNVTDIETWLRDPYAIYARYVLKLRALDPLDQPADAADYGSIVHNGIAAFLTAQGGALPPDSAARLQAMFEAEMLDAAIRPALRNWWRPRLRRIADWVIAAEQDRRQSGAPSLISPEASGEWTLDRASGRFTLRGRADRIERAASGDLAILDYKTGILPSEPDVVAGLSPQLPLEAAMAMEGAFGPALQGTVRELVYWRLSGGSDAGEAKILFRNKPESLADACETARAELGKLIDDFDNASQPYLSRPHPKARPRYSDYTQLARVAEWGWNEDS